MNKYLVTINFEWNDEMMQLLPEHREYIDGLIDEQVIEHYVVSMENQTVWVTLNAEDRTEAREIMMKSPFKPYWKLKVAELILWDGQNYRLPAVQLN